MTGGVGADPILPGVTPLATEARLLKALAPDDTLLTVCQLSIAVLVLALLCPGVVILFAFGLDAGVDCLLVGVVKCMRLISFSDMRRPSLADMANTVRFASSRSPVLNCSRTGSYGSFRSSLCLPAWFP